MPTSKVKVISKQNGVSIRIGLNSFYGDPDGDFVAENGSITGYVKIKRSVDDSYVVNQIYYTEIVDSSDTTIGTSGPNCVSLLNSNYFNTSTKLAAIDDVSYQNSIAEDQFLKLVDVGGGALRWSNEPISGNAVTSLNGLTGGITLASGNDNATIDASGSTVTIEVQPQYIYEIVKNVSGATLSKGTPVKVTGAAGSTPEVIAADAATNYPAHFILFEDISNGVEGAAIAFGHINQVSVPDASIYSEGDEVYLGASGGWTTTKPTGTNQIQKLGVILKVDTVSDTVGGIVQGAGRVNDVPNIPQGYIWAGNSSGVATPTDTAYIDISNSRVGIGTTTPSTPLEVIGTIKQKTGSGYTNYVQQSVQEAQLTFSTYSNNEASFPSAIKFSPSGTEAVRIDNAGQVGIGTTTPNYLLDVEGSGAGARVYNTSGLTNLYLTTTAGNNAVLNFGTSAVVAEGNIAYRTASSSMAFTTNESEAMRIDSSGKVGIGTTSPTQKLHVNGDVKIETDLYVDGDTYGIYHKVSDGQYYFDDYQGTRNVNAFLKTSRSDIIKYQDIGTIEYWNGSSWIDATSTLLSSVEKLLDGRQDTSWNVPSTYYKFRFTVTASTSWPTMAFIGAQLSWTGSTYPGYTMTVEEQQADTSWVTEVTADFTSANGVSNWGTAFLADNDLHTGRGGQSYATRITIDFYGWTPSNPSYTTIPLQNIFIYSNFSGTEVNDYQNLLSYSRQITAPNGISVRGKDSADSGRIYLYDDDNSHWVSVESPATLSQNLRFLLPSSYGSSGQVIQTDGSGNLSFASVTQATGNELENLVEDTTPQLGGTLDANGNTIDMGANVITDTKVGQWDTAYGWGDHSTEGYLTGITGQSIKNLSDVYSSMAPTDGQVLTYDTTNGWQAETPSGGVTVSGTPSNNQLAVWTTASEIEGDNNLTWTGTQFNIAGGAILSADLIKMNGRAPTSPVAGEVGVGGNVITQFHTTGTVTAGGVYVAGSSAWVQADADAGSTAIGLLAVATDAASPAEMLIEGSVKLASNTGFSTASKGDVLYLSLTAGELTSDISSHTTGDFVRVCGYVIDASKNYVYFKPDNTWLEL